MARPQALSGATRSALAVGALTAVAFVLRLVLMHDSLLGDELILYGIVHDRGLGDVLHVVRETEKTPPLGFVLSWATAHVGDPRVTVRLPSLLAGTALVPLAYLLGRRTVGGAAGLVAAALLALQPYQLFYATEARAYALVAFLAGLSTLCLLRALDTNRRGWWAGYVLATLGAAYTHYVAAFVLAVELAWAAWTHRERLRELLVANGLVVLGLLPWLPSYLVQQSHSADEARRIALLAPPSASYFARINAQLFFGEPFAALRDLPGRVPLALSLAALLGAIAFAVARGVRGARPSREAVLIGLLAAATPVGIAVLSARPDRSFMLPRNLIPSALPMALLAGALLVGLAAVGRRVAVAAVAVVLVVAAIGAARALEHTHRRSAYRDAAAFIDARGRPGDPVVQYFFFGDGGALGTVLSLNLREPHPVDHVVTSAEGVHWERARRAGRVFMVVPLVGVFKPTRHLGRTAGPGAEFVLRAERRFTGIEDLLVGEYVAR